MANRQLDKNSAAVRKQLETRKFEGEEGEEYGASKFGEFGDYFRRKKLKLQNEDAVLRQSVPGKPQIFKDVVAHVASYTQPPPEELRRLLVLHGAAFIKYLDYKTMVTHIVASTLPPKKADEWRRLRVVTPAWVVDSVAAGKLLPWADYRLIGEGPGQKRIRFDGGKLAVQEGRPDQMAGYRAQGKDSFYAHQVQSRAALYDSGGGSSSISPSLFPQLDTAAADSSGDADDARTADHDGQEPEHGGHGGGGDGGKAPETRGKPLTSEEHNARLLSDPRIRKASAANPEFLQQFYAESRLHHLSTWKAELKAKMQRLAREKSLLRAGGAAAAADKKRRAGTRRYILHVDFDCFFCAVSLKSAPPACADKPAVVAHSAGSASEIASCNYPARAFGVKNGMWMRRALELCPDLKVLPYDFPAYEEASRRFYEAILDVGGVVQSVSIDEALVDVTRLVQAEGDGDGDGDGEDGQAAAAQEQARADELATALRRRIKEETGCDVSVGIGGNILLAKVALRRAKPAGQSQIRPAEVLEVLGALRVEQMPGVAHSIGGKLEEMGVRLVGELRAVSKERLAAALGPKTGARLYGYARGLDDAAVGDQPARKSVSAEVNWGIRFVAQDEADEFVLNLCRELERRLLHEQVRGRSLTLKVLRRAADAPLDPEKHLGHGKCDVFSKSVVFGVATHDAARLGKEAVSLLRSFRFSPGDLRGLGVQLQKLEPIRSPAAVAAADSSQKTLSFGQGGSGGGGGGSGGGGGAPSGRTARPKSVFTTPVAASIRREEHAPSTPAVFASTQFVMPANPDPSVLAELPPDILRRLVGEQGRGDEGSSGGSRCSSSSRPPSPAKRALSADIELPPDIDPEVFNALPADVRAEILAETRRGAARAHSNSPAPSPRKAQKTKTVSTSGGRSPVKRGLWGTRGLAAAAAARERRHDAEANRVQATLVVPAGAAPDDGAAAVDEVDPDFLAALPDDVRAEVLEDYRRQRQQQQQEQEAGQALRLQGSRGRPEGSRPSGPAAGEEKKPLQPSVLPFPPAPAKARFGETAAVLSLAEAKQMLQAWHESARGASPHEADVAVVAQYVADVVAQERDMDKARKLVVWLTWLVEEHEEGEEGEEEGKQGPWQAALACIRAAVQQAMRARGLGPLQFD